MCTAASLFTACLWSTIHQASAFLGAVASITTLYDYNTRRYHVDASMGTGNTGIKLLKSPSVVIRGGGSCGSPAAAAAAADGDGSTVGDIVASETTVAAETAEGELAGVYNVESAVEDLKLRVREHAHFVTV